MLIYRKTRTGSYVLMDVKEIRRYKLKRLVSEFRTKKEAAEALGLEYQVLYQLTTDTKRSTGKPFNMGDELARKVEKRLKKPKGWMDSLDEEMTHIDSQTMLDAASLKELDESDQTTVRALIQSLLSKKSPH